MRTHIEGCHDRHMATPSLCNCPCHVTKGTVVIPDDGEYFDAEGTLRVMPNSLTPSPDASRYPTATDNLRPNQYEIPRSTEEQIDYMIEDALDLIATTATREMRRSILRALLGAAKELSCQTK